MQFKLQRNFLIAEIFSGTFWLPKSWVELSDCRNIQWDFLIAEIFSGTFWLPKSSAELSDCRNIQWNSLIAEVFSSCQFAMVKVSGVESLRQRCSGHSGMHAWCVGCSTKLWEMCSQFFTIFWHIWHRLRFLRFLSFLLLCIVLGFVKDLRWQSLHCINFCLVEHGGIDCWGRCHNPWTKWD